MAEGAVQKYSEYDHHAPDITLENVHESWDNLRAQCPIGRSDAYGGMWVVTGYAEAHEIFHDPETFSSTPLIIPPFFGHDYDESVQALWWLLPGTVALTGSKVLTSYIFSRGRPLVNTGITVVSLVVTTVALFALVPAFGVNGAALASSLAYCAHFAAALYAYRRLSGEPLRDVLIPERGDARLYVDAWRGLVSRGGRRATLDAGAPRPGV